MSHGEHEEPASTLDDILNHAELLALQMQELNSGSPIIASNDKSKSENGNDAIDPIEEMMNQAQAMQEAFEQAAGTAMENPSNGEERDDDDKALDDILAEADALAAQIRAGENTNLLSKDGVLSTPISTEKEDTFRLTEIKPSETDDQNLVTKRELNHEEGEQNEPDLDAMLAQAQELADKMRSPSSPGSQEEATTSGGVETPVLVREAEATLESLDVIADRQSESALDTPELLRQTEETLNRPSSTFDSEAVGETEKTPKVRSALTMDTPALVRQADALIGKRTSVVSPSELDTPELIRQSEAALAKAESQQDMLYMPTAAQPQASPIDDIVNETDRYLQELSSTDDTDVMQNTTAAAACGGADADPLRLDSSFDENVNDAPPHASPDKNVEIMQKAFTALREASDECAELERMTTPATVSISSYMDDVSSVGSRSFDDAHKRQQPPNQQQERYYPQKSQTATMDDRPPLIPRSTPPTSPDKSAVDTVIEETRIMAQTLERMANAHDEKIRNKDVPNISVSLDSEFKVEPSSPAAASRQSDTSTPRSPPVLFDENLKWERESMKSDPNAKFVKITSATEGDDDYVPMQDFSPKKKSGKRSTLLGKFAGSKTRRRRRRLLRIAAVTVSVVTAVLYYGTFFNGGTKPALTPPSTVTDNKSMQRELRTEELSVQSVGDYLLNESNSIKVDKEELGHHGVVPVTKTKQMKQQRKSPFLRKISRAILRSFKYVALITLFAMPISALMAL